jgi:pimeloyl-ACP methyl ester carboxylesterase
VLTGHSRPLVDGWENFNRLIRADFQSGLFKMFQDGTGNPHSHLFTNHRRLTTFPDRLARLTGADPIRIPVVHENPLETSALPTPDSYKFFSEWEGKSPWENKCTLRSVEMLRANDASAHIHRIAPTPLLMSVAEKDVLTPTDLALEAYSRAREPKQLQILPGAGHFDGYSGPWFERNAGTQTDFLRRTLCANWEDKVRAK